MDTLQQLKKKISAGMLDEAMQGLDALLSATPDDADALFERGKLNWRMGRRTAAMTDYGHAALLDPDSPAATALASARSIEDFYNTDLYNP